MARIGATLAVAVLVAVGPRIASAQEHPQAEGPGQTQHPRRTQPRARQTHQRRAPQTPGAERRLAVRVTTRAEGLSRRVQRHLDEARRDGDARRVQCLDDVLSQANAVVRMSREATERLQRGIALSDDARRRHAVSVLGVLDRRIQVLDAELRICNGDRPDAGPSGRTRVIVTVDRDVPREDPTRLGSEPPTVPYIPPPASPSI